MGLQKTNKNYYYNLGRVVALVEFMNNLPDNFYQKVFNNAAQCLPYHLNKALRKEEHILHSELLETSEVVLLKGNIPHCVITAYDKDCCYSLGYYHQKIDIEKNYKKEILKVEHYTPECVEVPEDMENIIDELRR